MRNLRKDIQKIKEEFSLQKDSFKEVSHLHYDEILKKINSKFLVTHQYTDNAWWWKVFKNLKQYSIHLKQGAAFEILDTLLPNREVSYWFVASDENGKYLLYEASIEAIQLILRKMYGFEYYLVDKKYTWILCENHHDILIGLGEEITSILYEYEVKIKPIGWVQNIFELKNGGLILSLKSNFEKTFLAIGDPIKLVKPDGQTLSTKIEGMTADPLDILIEAKYAKEDIPPGTIVWLIT